MLILLYAIVPVAPDLNAWDDRLSASRPLYARRRVPVGSHQIQHINPSSTEVIYGSISSHATKYKILKLTRILLIMIVHINLNSDKFSGIQPL